MPQNPPQFTSPTGRPQKISMATQSAMDKWTKAGMSPPQVKPGESQYFYTTRISSSLVNRQRGRYGEDETTDRIFDRRDVATTPTKPVQSEVNAVKPKGKTSFGKSIGSKSFGALLGLGTAIQAQGKR
jgi:hypothetical protein